MRQSTTGSWTDIVNAESRRRFSYRASAGGGVELMITLVGGEQDGYLFSSFVLFHEEVAEMFRQSEAASERAEGGRDG